MSFGLVLSGGAAFGLANAGVLQVFEEHGKKPDVIAGSSMGAIIAALYSACPEQYALAERMIKE